MSDLRYIKYYSLRSTTGLEHSSNLSAITIKVLAVKLEMKQKILKIKQQIVF